MLPVDKYSFDFGLGDRRRKTEEIQEFSFTSSFEFLARLLAKFRISKI